MDINFDALSVDELEKLIRRAQRKLDRRRLEAVKKAQTEVGKIAKNLGVSVEDLLQENPSRKKAERKITRRKIKPGVRKPAKVKYRNPADSSQTWTGRGKRPIWLRDALENGAQLDSYLI